MSELFEFERIGNVNIPTSYKSMIYRMIEGKVDSVFHQRILEPLFGRVSIREGQHNTIVIRLITTIHGQSHVVGITLQEFNFGEVAEKEIADKLFHSFLHSFGTLALSAFLKSSVNVEEEG